MRIFSAVFAVFALAAATAEAAERAPDLSGNALLESCRAFLLQKTSDHFGQGVCVGIMHTVVASQAGVKQQYRSCPPTGSTFGQDAAVIVAFIDKHPERRHEPLLSLAIDAFHEAWPCQE